MIDDGKLRRSENGAYLVSGEVKQAERGLAARDEALAAQAERSGLRVGPFASHVCGDELPEAVFGSAGAQPSDTRTPSCNSRR